MNSYKNKMNNYKNKLNNKMKKDFLDQIQKHTKCYALVFKYI